MVSRFAERSFADKGALVASCVLAVAAITAAYATLSTSSVTRERAKPHGRPPVLELEGAFGRELGGDGFYWQWIGDAATLRVRYKGAFWVGFRAESLNRPRRLNMVDGEGARFQVRVPTSPVERLAGPFQADGSTEVQLRPQPRPSSAPSPDSRQLSVYMSMPTLSEGPAVVLPGTGFWPREIDGNQEFNWLRHRGRLEVVARPGVSKVSVSAVVQSSGRPRRVSVTSAASNRPPAEVVVGSRPERIDLGVVALEHGRGSLELVSEPSPTRVEGEPRFISVRIIEPRAVAVR